MSDYLREKILEAFWEAKEINFPYATELESFARGVEHGLCNASTLCNEGRAHCAGCGEFKYTPLRRDHMGGYVCLTCIDKKLDEYLFLEKQLAA